MTLALAGTGPAMHCDRDPVASGGFDFLHKLLIVSILLATTGTAMTQQLTETRQAAARAAIDSVLNERFLAGWNRHDAHLFASAFAPDADFTNILGVGASGRDNIEKFHAEAFERFFLHSQQTAQIQKVRFLSADVAVVDVRWHSRRRNERFYVSCCCEDLRPRASCVRAPAAWLNSPTWLRSRQRSNGWHNTRAVRAWCGWRASLGGATRAMRICSAAKC